MKALWNSIKWYWTNWAALAIVILGWTQTTWGTVEKYLPDKWRGPVWMILGVVLILLRSRREIKSMLAKPA